MNARCPDCGRPVAYFAEHLDVDCMSEAYGLGWEDRKEGAGLFSGMKRQAENDKDNYIKGWHAADDQMEPAP